MELDKLNQIVSGRQIAQIYQTKRGWVVRCEDGLDILLTHYLYQARVEDMVDIAREDPPTFNIIACVDRRMGIGKGVNIPWHIPKEQQYFRKMTDGCVVIMGHNTWLSLKKPLENRINVVITHTKIDGVETYDDLYFALRQVDKYNKPIWVIGGAQLYKLAMQLEECERIYISYLPDDYGCDIFFPSLEGWHKESTKYHGFGDVVVYAR